MITTNKQTNNKQAESKAHAHAHAEAERKEPYISQAYLKEVAEYEREAQEFEELTRECLLIKDIG